jgi:hypothetical protein
MRTLCAKLVIVAGVMLLLIALIQTVLAGISIFRILNEGGHADWTYYVWMSTGIVRSWLVTIAFILVGFGLLSKTDK